MNVTPEKILLVGNDPDISDLIARQALQPLGYQVQTALDVNTAILEAARFAPDLVIADLDMPGLNGKDLLVALNSQGLQIPVIVVARKGEEQKVVQAFRLGASDYLLWPLREAEAVTAAERALRQVKERRARQRLDQQLKETNQELQRRVRELTTIFAVGKAVISITDQRVLFDKIVEGMVYVAEADFGWLLLRDDHSRTFILSAHRNLPDAWARKMGQSLEDGISSLVALSGQALAISGEPLKRFKVASLGQSAVVVPVKIQKEVIGLLVIVRKADQLFDKNMISLLEAVADYASVSLVNARLFRALQETADASLAGEQAKREQLQVVRKEIQSVLQPMIQRIDVLLEGKMGKFSNEKQQVLKTIRDAMQRAIVLTTHDQPTKPPVRLGK